MKSVDPRLALGVLGPIAASVLLGACQDATTPTAPSSAPSAALAAAPVAAVPTRAMAALGSSFRDATDQFTASMKEEKTRAALQAALFSLSENLQSGDADAAERQLKIARALLGRVDSAEASELAPITLALDNAELVLKGETPGGEPAAAAEKAQP